MFRRKKGADKLGYYSSGISSKILKEGELTKVKIDGQILNLTRVNDEIIAFGDTCPHGAASLAKGSLSGYKISCPDHGYCFDMRSGRIMWPEDESYRLHLYDLKLEHGEIKIRFGES